MTSMNSMTMSTKCPSHDVHEKGPLEDGTFTNRSGVIRRVPDPNIRTQVVIHIIQGNVNNPSTYSQESIRLLLPVDMYVIQMVSMIREQLCKSCFNHQLLLNTGSGAVLIRMTSKLVHIPPAYRNTDGAIHFTLIPHNTFGSTEGSELLSDGKADGVFNLEGPGFWQFLEILMEEKDIYSGLLEAPIDLIKNIPAHLGINFQKIGSRIWIKDAFVVLPSVSDEGNVVHFLENNPNLPLHPSGLTIHLPCQNGTIQSLHPRPTCFSFASQYDLIVFKIDEMMGLMETEYDWSSSLPVDLLVEIEPPFVLIDFLAFCEQMEFPIHVYEINH